MLARTPATLVYLSAEDLGITERERAGLIEVRDDLASGRVKHVPFPGFGCMGGDHSLFNMSAFEGYSHCGTCHCIGGFMKHKGFIEHYSSSDFIDGGWSVSLQHLFYPLPGITGDETVQQAVLACDHFLAGAGPDCWPMALADIPAA